MDIKKIGIAAWGLRELSLEDQLALCKKLGYSSVELGIANAPKELPIDAAELQIQNVKSLYQKYDLPLVCAATGDDFTQDEETVADQIKKIQRVLKICESLEVSYLRIFAGFSPAAEVHGTCWDRMIYSLNTLSAIAAERGVTLAIETHGGVNTYVDGVEHFHSATTDSELLIKLLSETDPSIKFVFDPANLCAVGYHDPMVIYKLLKNRIAYIHLKNFKQLDSGHIVPAPVGAGLMDTDHVLKALRDYSGYAMVEYEIPETIDEGLRCSMEILKQYV